MPSTSAGLLAVQVEQSAIADTLTAQIAANQAIQDRVAESLAVAQATNDTAMLDSIYNQLDASGYTDPNKLTEQLNSVNQNIVALDTMIAEAVAIEIPNSTLNVDTTTLGVSSEDVYNVAGNPDLVRQTNVTYTDNTVVTQQYY